MNAHQRRVSRRADLRRFYAKVARGEQAIVGFNVNGGHVVLASTPEGPLTMGVDWAGGRKDFSAVQFWRVRK